MPRFPQCSPLAYRPAIYAQKCTDATFRSVAVRSPPTPAVFGHVSASRFCSGLSLGNILLDRFRSYINAGRATSCRSVQKLARVIEWQVIAGSGASDRKLPASGVTLTFPSRRGFLKASTAVPVGAAGTYVIAGAVRLKYKDRLSGTQECVLPKCL
jgi:hypothetical protein